ncbi:hypothetical protein GF351_00295 [Candidatus Woesearchaeota archaeon]|nr:hypothetical protein [Candidatus Woesearchaeota archaeon]
MMQKIYLKKRIAWNPGAGITNKKAIAWETLGKIVLVLLTLLVAMVILMLITQKGFGLLDFLSL